MPAATDTANPAPLGLVGFGLTTVLLSLVNAGIAGIELEYAVVPLAIAFGGTIQLFAGLLEYREGNTFGLTAFTSYGAFWWWFALVVLFSNTGVLPEVGARAIGITLLGWGVFTTYMWLATFRLNWALWTVFALLSVTFYLLGAGDVLGVDWLVVAGGYAGLLTGAAAMYTSFAEVVNWSFDGSVLPLGDAPLSESTAATARTAD